jgi:DNA-binding CsgD family transcriptional regulator
VELLEREDQLAQLDRLLDEARAGSGRMALISGDAGVGKTSLVRAFLARLSASVRVLWGACDPLDAPRPLGPFHDMPTIAVSLDGQRGRHDVLSTLFEALGDTRPTVMVVEDIHWADEPTLDALRFLGRRIDRTSGLVIATYREDDVASAGQLRTVLGDLATAPGCRRFAVRPLTAGGVATLAADKGLDPARLYTLTGGNPFFVTEVLAAPGIAVPPTVAHAVLARLARLEASSRQLVDVVALAPRRLEPGIALAVAEVGPQAMDDCLERGVLVLDGRWVGFRHELARLAVESAIPEIRRRRLNVQLLAELERAGESDLARLAHHAAAGRDAVSTLRYGPAAAAEASARGAYRAAAEHLGRTIQIVDGLPAADEAELLSAWAAARTPFDDPRTLLPILERAIDLRREAGDGYGEGRDLTSLARLTRRTGNSESVDRLQAMALARLEQLEPGPDLASCHAAIAIQAVATYRIEECLEHAGLAIDLGRRTGAGKAVTMALDAKAEALTCGRESPEGTETSEENIRLAVRDGDTEGAASALVNAGGNLIVTRQYAASRTYLERALSLAIEGDFDYLAAFARASKARLDCEQGRWSEALQSAEAVRAEPSAAPIVRTVALTAIGRVLVRRGGGRGDARAGREALEEAWSLGRAGDLALQWPIVAGRAEAAWLAGRSDEIRGIVGDVYERCASAPVRWAAGELGFWLWRVGAFDDRPDRLAEPWARQVAGDWRGAAAIWAGLGCPYERAGALADGDEPAMREALSLFNQLVAEPALDRLRAKMRRAGIGHIPVGPRRTTRDAPAHLTQRQLEILGLLELGLSNAEIASRLFITEKTASHHVTAILAKLDVRSRAEAGAAARKMGVVGQ